MSGYRLPLASVITALLCLAAACTGTAHQTTSTDVADGIKTTIAALRQMPDDQRAKATKDLALRIRQLTVGDGQLSLAQSLANLSTEGDFGRDTLQEVTNTLTAAVKGAAGNGQAPAGSYASLAQLARYEGMSVDLDTPAYREALAEVDRLAAIRAAADFTLTDLDGHTWTRSALTGKVVLVNFWATWCPPCRKEMPDLDALYREFKDKGLVILALSNEPDATVRAYIEAHPVTYPILLDAGSRVSEALKIDSIPKTFLYDRSGALVAQSIDMRTRGQFLAMLKLAGLG
jgi:peroxiredoxin